MKNDWSRRGNAWVLLFYLEYVVRDSNNNLLLYCIVDVTTIYIKDGTNLIIEGKNVLATVSSGYG